MDGKSSTSLREQVIFYYIQKFYSDAENRYKHPAVGELDIYISSANLAIEYDGGYWHKSRLSRDNEKNERANKAGIRLIRIREYKLTKTRAPFGEIYLPKNTGNLYDVSFLNQIFRELGILIENKDLMDYTIDENDYKRNLPEIYSRIYDVPVEKSLEDMCGVEFWDTEFNGDLVPSNIPSDEWAYAALRCKKGRSIELPRYHRQYKSQCKSLGEGICENCVSTVICPLMHWCKGNNNQAVECQIVEDAVRQMIKGGKSYRSMERGNDLDAWMWRNSTLGVKLVEEVLSLKKNNPMRKNYIHFLGFRTEEKGDGIIFGSIFVRDEKEKQLLEKFASGLKYTKLSVQIFQR